jgi:hypothetical protein
VAAEALAEVVTAKVKVPEAGAVAVNCTETEVPAAMLQELPR